MQTQLRKLCLMAVTLLLAALPIDGKTLKEMMDWLHETRQLNFVYDASLPGVDAEYRGPALEPLSNRKALRQLFSGTGISYQMKGNYVILKPSATQSAGHTVLKSGYTLSGIVHSENGEPLINATVYDLTGGVGTTTNEHGFFSLTLPGGERQLRCFHAGYGEKVEQINLQEDRHLNIRLTKESSRLPELIVKADLNSPLLTTQTGRKTLTQADIRTEFALLSSPDLVKTLQRSSGVAEGLELMSGMFVHGGNGDENLFLIDGTPLYDTNHAMGLFSSFNPDVVKNVDFYKSGFPARYGGRLSSVVDVRTKDGDMEHTHGTFRVGQLDASLHLEGPIRRERTSYSIGVRRSYSDLFMALIPWITSNDKVSMGYYLMDVNAKVTHHFSPRSKLSASLYCGNDNLHTKDVWKGNEDTDDEGWEETSKYKLKWGNINGALNWNYQFSQRLFANFTAVYTHNRSRLYGYNDDRQHTAGEGDRNIWHTEHSYDNTINDAGYRAAFDLRPVPAHHIRFGHDYTCHTFRPQTIRLHNFWGDEQSLVDTVRMDAHNHQTSHEMTAYVEDEMTLTERWSLNAGFHTSLFTTEGKTFVQMDPRLAVKYQFSNTLSAKASLTRMSQYMHKLQNTYLSLPTDYWVPTTRRLHPMHAWQAAAGLYCQPNHHWTLTLESYYKQSHHILQYDSWTGLEPPADRWDQTVMDGRGRFYGLELDAAYHTGHLQLEGSYTLSWNKRRYDDYFPRWFYDKYDNRHKLSLSLHCQLSRKTSVYAAWNYHSGYHTTVPTQVAELPVLPGPDGKYDDEWQRTDLVLTQPNNIALPNYHRLDVGFDFRHTTSKRHHEHIWNLSVYNVYGHCNPLYVTVRYDEEQERYRAYTTSLPLLVPSFSYTVKF